MIIPFRVPIQAFNSSYLPLLKNTDRTNVIYGGASSGKSIFQAQRILVRFFEGGHNFLVLRKTAKTSRHSTYSLFRQLLLNWGVPDDWYEINKSNMTITNKINRSVIMFAGLDNVEKLKSITFESGVLTDIWVEEASEISKNDYLQLCVRLRGVSKVSKQITLTFNPINKNHWLKKYFFDNPKSDTTVLKTTYIDNKFLTKEDIELLESLKEIDENYYNVYALGEWGELGSTIYSNYVIQDFDYRNYDIQNCGIDYGYNDPNVWLDIRFYDNNIYVCNEVYATGLTNADFISAIRKEAEEQEIIGTADSARPDLIEEMNRAGFSIYPANKAPGSIFAGITWLKARKIYVHKTNCPETAKEIESYSWAKDSAGNPTDKPVPWNDHAMDALRYGIDPWRNNEPVDSEDFYFDEGREFY